ncbi:MAG: hypothetical protein ACK53E_05190 [Pseudanabaena sp.]
MSHLTEPVPINLATIKTNCPNSYAIFVQDLLFTAKAVSLTESKIHED